MKVSEGYSFFLPLHPETKAWCQGKLIISIMEFKRKVGKDVSVKSVNDLFTTDKRKLRIELFGSYLSKSFVLESVLSNVKSKINEIKKQLENLNTLQTELQKQVEEKRAQEFQRRVEKMTDSEAQTLFEQLKARLAQ